MRNKFYITAPTQPPPPSSVIAKGTRQNNVYVFDKSTQENCATAPAKPSPPPTTDLSPQPAKANPRFQIPSAFIDLHKLYAHRHVAALRRLVSAIPALQPKPRAPNTPPTTQYSPCTQAKMTRAPHIPNPITAPTHALQKVTLDTAGPFPESVRGHRYLNPLTDAYSSVSLALPTKTKGAAAKAVTNALARWQTQIGRTTKRLQTDGAKELSKGHIGRF